jgi:hypothetical protein
MRKESYLQGIAAICNALGVSFEKIAFSEKEAMDPRLIGAIGAGTLGGLGMYAATPADQKPYTNMMGGALSGATLGLLGGHYMGGRPESLDPRILTGLITGGAGALIGGATAPEGEKLQKALVLGGSGALMGMGGAELLRHLDKNYGAGKAVMTAENEAGALDAARKAFAGRPPPVTSPAVAPPVSAIAPAAGTTT